MKATPVIERAGSYLNLHASRAGRNPDRSPPHLFVTISREAGAGATTLANLLAKRLNSDRPAEARRWRVFDGNLVEAMLRDRCYHDGLARYLPEDSFSEIDATVGELLGLHPNLWEMIQDTGQLIRRLAQEGHCILIGRGANFLTREIPGGLHVRLVGEPEDRARHMAIKLGITLQQARLRNQSADRARNRYTLKHFNRSVADPSGYDALFNTSQISPLEIRDWLLEVIRSRQKARKPGPTAAMPTQPAAS